jgi:hypothetical protein
MTSDIFKEDNRFYSVNVPLNFVRSSEFKIPRKYKLIENLSFDLDLSESFSVFFAEKLIEKTELYFNKKFDWKKVWIYPDSDYGLVYLIDNKTNNYYTLVNGYLAVGAFKIVLCEIYINDRRNNKIVYLNNEIQEYDLEFNLVIVPPYNASYIEKMVLKEKMTNHIFNSIQSFKIFTHLSTMPHEGKFAITLIDIEDKEKVSATLERARAKWNTQTDQARETGDSTLERGYCHTITFDGVEDNVGYWYIDAGTAHDGIHEFLLKELSDSGIKIKSVEIQML